MLPNAFLEIVILIILVWFFESKIIPQILLMFLTVFMMLQEFTAGTAPQYAFFFAGVIIYSGLKIFEGKDDIEETGREK